MPILINDNTARVQYTATSGQTVFAVPFEFFENGDLKVYRNSTLQTITTHYTLTGAGVTGGGNLTFVSGVTLNDIITIVRDIPIKRVTDFPLSGPFNIAALNLQLDQLTAMVQEVNTLVTTRVPLLAEFDQPSAFSALPTRASRANNYFVFDSNGNPAVASSALAVTDFTQAGTGAVLRTAQNKMRDTVSVKDFGAVGDGVTDDTAAFTAAAAAANYVVVPPTSASYLLNGSVVASDVIWDIQGFLSGAGGLPGGNSSVYRSRAQIIGGFNAPSGVRVLNKVVVEGNGDNTTFRGASAAYFEARDRTDVTAANKGVLYALALSVVPSVARNNVPFDDVAGLTISNTTGTVGAKGTDSFYVSNNTFAFGDSVTGTSEWYSIFTADCNADVGIVLAGKIATFGIDLGNSNLVIGSAMRFPNNGYLVARNAANSANLNLIGLDGNNTVRLGGTNVSGVQVTSTWFGATVPVVVATGTYTVLSTDNDIIFNAACTVTLPAAGSFPGRWLNVKTTGNTVTSASSNVVPLAGGAAGTAILASVAGRWARLVSDGANWQTMSSNA